MRAGHRADAPSYVCSSGNNLEKFMWGESVLMGSVTVCHRMMAS